MIEDYIRKFLEDDNHSIGIEDCEVCLTNSYVSRIHEDCGGVLHGFYSGDLNELFCYFNVCDLCGESWWS